MRLLILTPQFPYPPHQGTAIRNYNLIHQLAARHKIHLLSFLEGPGKVEMPLRADCAAICTVMAPRRGMLDRIRTLLLSPLPDMALRLESEAMHQQLDELLTRHSYDVIQVEGIEMGPYLLQIASGKWRMARDRPLLVFDDHNCEYVLQRRVLEADARRRGGWLGAFYSLIQWRKLVHYERRCCRAADRVMAVSEADGRALERLVPGLEVTIVPNGVDTAAYDPRRVEPLDLGPGAIVFTGKMDFRPNVDGALWFAQQVLPLVRSKRPEVHFYIVGQQPHSRLDVLRGDPAVTITGFVPRIQPYIAGAAVYVIPLRMGGGTRLKVLEAMALGRGLVSTRLGCEGFPLMRSGEHLLVADGAAPFAQAVLALLRDPSLGRGLGQAARDLVTARYDWAEIVPRLEALY
ncbi:MAG: glycosyltransferase [Chloroflexota bacterium]|nr:glycosyltransferase [Chloroflexota bacterium]